MAGWGVGGGLLQKQQDTKRCTYKGGCYIKIDFLLTA